MKVIILEWKRRQSCFYLKTLKIHLMAMTMMLEITENIIIRLIAGYIR